MTAKRRVSRESLRLTAPGSPHTFHSPTDSHHGNCHVCRRVRLSAFTAAGFGEPRRLRPTAASPRHRRSRLSFSFSDTSTRPSMGDVSGIGRKGEAAIAGVRRTRSADDQIHIVGLATGSGEARLRALAASGRGSETRTAAKSVRAATGTTGALIFEHFRARLPAQSPAIAASRGLAVHSVRS